MAASIEVLIPNAGQTSGEATIVRWLKHPGEMIRYGDILLEVETDKATLEVEASASGILDDVRFVEGDVVPVLTAIAVIRSEAGPAENKGASPEPLAALPANAPSPSSTPAAATDLIAIMRVHRPGRPLASPLARRLAAKTGLDLQQVRGSGPRGRVMKADLAHHPTAPAAAPAGAPSAMAAEAPDGRWEPFSATRRAIAERLAASVRDIPQVTLTTEADAEALVELYGRLKADLEPGTLSLTDLFVKITAAALRAAPTLNAWVENNGVRRFEAIHIGLAVDTDRGLMVPVIRHADTKGLSQLGQERRDLAERARLGQLRLEEMHGATFTITNLGPYDIDAFTPIINPPECAILGIGRIVKKAVVRGDVLVPGKTVTLSLTFDHRSNDGAPAARFLQQIKNLVEKPHLLMA